VTGVQTCALPIFINDEKGIAKLNGMFLIIFSFIAVISLIAGFTLAFFSDFVFGNELTQSELNTASILLIILTVNLAIKFPNIVFISYIRANERFIFQKLVDLLKTLLNPFLVLPILFLGYGSIGMAVAITGISLLIEIIHMIYSFKKLSISFKFNAFDKKLFKEMTIFSSFIFLNMVIDQINWNVDKFLIGRFHGTIPVAIYSLAAVFNTQYLHISTAISSIFVPRIHRLVESLNGKQELTNLFIKVGRIQFIILSLILSGFIFFGKTFISWWAGEDYVASYYIAVILISAVTIPIIQNLGIEIQRAMNLHKFRSLIYFVIALLNIGISIPLVIRYEGIGAALGTAIALLIGNVLIINIYYHKRVGIDIIFFWKEIFKIFPAFILPILIGYLFTTYVNIYMTSYFFLGVGIYSVVFILSMWFIGMNNYERDLFVKPFKIIITKMKG
jgi:O-antigen/teichoic acid export membrane protein